MYLFENKEEIFDKMIEWEHEHGESILDDSFGSHIKETTFMAWALGKGYTTPEKYEMWLQKWSQNDIDAIELQGFLYDDYGDIEYAIVLSKDGEWHEEEYHKGYMIVAEFVFEFHEYQRRFKNFLNE